MRRVIILMMDSFGIGAAPDAKAFGDEEADTLGHLAEYCQKVRKKPLELPHLSRYGLQEAYFISTAKRLSLSTQTVGVQAAYGAASEKSLGKDTPSGHWEMAGVPVEFEWGYFPTTEKCFPSELIQALIAKTGIPGVLGEKHASGTVILEELGQAHIQSGKPIVYTSADSVFQIAAHEQYFGLDKLYEVCDVARELVNDYNIGRVIARPFVGEKGQFERTGNRRDLAVEPPRPTLLDKAKQAGLEVISIGKIADIYAHKGFTQKIKATGNDALFDKTLEALKLTQQDAIIFTNFVDFDSMYGHRRNPLGYAEALEAFDRRLVELESMMTEEDLIVVTADHGCDPTLPGSDHTRENVPALFFAKNIRSMNLGLRDSFADIGATIADYLGVSSKGLAGKSCKLVF